MAADSPMNVYWLEQAVTEVPERDDWLSRAEAEVLSSMKFVKRRSDWRLGRWTAKNAVALCLGAHRDLQALQKIEIRASLSGAPEVFYGGEPAPFSISLSHREGLGACAVGPASVALGCDLEFIEPHSETFVADYFSAEEQSVIAAASPRDRDAFLALFWSAKESALKALREGLRLDTRSVVVELGDTRFSQPDSWNPLRVCCSNGQTFLGWCNQSGGYVRTMLAASPSQAPIFLSQSRDRGEDSRTSLDVRPAGHISHFVQK